MALPNLAPGYLTALKEMRMRASENAKDRAQKDRLADRSFWTDTVMDTVKLGANIYGDWATRDAASEKDAWDRGYKLESEGIDAPGGSASDDVAEQSPEQRLADIGSIPKTPDWATMPENEGFAHAETKAR